MLLVAYFISAFAVSKYAKAVRDKKGSILTAEQMDACRAAYGTSAEVDENTKLTGRQKGVLVIFGLSFDSLGRPVQGRVQCFRLVRFPDRQPLQLVVVR